jgi:hypothetical protein
LPGGIGDGFGIAGKKAASSSFLKKRSKKLLFPVWFNAVFGRRRGALGPARHKSFLVLFFKKEHASLNAGPAKPVRQ